MTALIQRPLRGSRVSSFYPVKTLPALASLDSAFQLQEYISLLIRLDVHDVDKIVAVPDKTEAEEKEEKEKETEEKKVDQACWIYEQLRRLAQDLTHPLITTLQQECTRLTCPEMKAGEWLYLCVAHGTEGAMEQCCAIDYILHTLDSATALLNSPRAFPSRILIDKTSHRHFSSLARRLGRIFAHAYFHHREAFEQAEAESSLYARFLALTTKFELVPAEFQVIPSRTEDIDVGPPRLLAAGVDSNTFSSTEESSEDWQNEHNKNPPGLRNENPRKIGRNRTDTMIHSDAFAVAEELKEKEEGLMFGASPSIPTEEPEPNAQSSSPELVIDEVSLLDVLDEAAAPAEEDLQTPNATDDRALRPEPEPETDEMNVTASSSTALWPATGDVEIIQAESPVTSEMPIGSQAEESEEVEPPSAVADAEIPSTSMPASEAPEPSSVVELADEKPELVTETIPPSEESSPIPVPAPVEDALTTTVTPAETSTDEPTPTPSEESTDNEPVVTQDVAPVVPTPETEDAVEPTPSVAKEDATTATT